VAQALAEDGWTVVLAGRRKEALEAVVAGGSGLTGLLDAIPTVRPEPLIGVAEVGRAVRYMATLPLDANIATMTLMATKMPFIGRG
jgi:NADP-dependent 3-hydroxy acid dehydrogenase YdfG